jgi:hypothetical protein
MNLLALDEEGLQFGSERLRVDGSELDIGSILKIDHDQAA